MSKQRKKNNSRNRRGQPGVNVADLERQICSVTDPFCPHARGAKYNTSGNPQTLTVQYRKVITITTGDTGWAFFSMDGGANVADCYYSDVVDSSTTYAVLQPNAGVGTLPTEGSDSTYYRVVTSGFRFWDTAPRTATGGVVITLDVPNLVDFIGDSFVVGDILPNSRTNVADRRAGCGWFSSQTNRAYPFITETTSATGVRSGAIVAISGAASSVVGQIEIVYNVEYQPVFGSSNLAAPATAHGRIARPVQEMVDQFATNVNPHIDGGSRKSASETILSRVKKFVRNAIPFASAGVGFMQGGLPGAIAGFAAGDRLMLENVQEID
jgi:hypothetical protein